MKAEGSYPVSAHGQNHQRYFSSPMGLSSRSARFDSRDLPAKPTRHGEDGSRNGSLRFLYRAIGLIHLFDRAPKGQSRS